MEKIRLACRLCDRNDFDGVAELPYGWFDVENVQSYEASVQSVNPEKKDETASVFDWFTHLVVCPECYQAEIRPELVS